MCEPCSVHVTVIQPKSSLKGQSDHPALLIPKTAATVQHDKLRKAKHFIFAQDVAAMYALLLEGMHTRRVDFKLISTQA